MPRPAIAEGLLSLVTTPDRAASIVGDLVEESRSHGVGWCSLQVLGTALALCSSSVRADPWRWLRLAVIGLVVWFGAQAVMVVVTGLPWYPWQLAFRAPGFWVRVVSVACGANLLTGMILGRWASNERLNGVVPLVAFWLVVSFTSPLLVWLFFHAGSPNPVFPYHHWLVWALRALLSLFYSLVLVLGGSLARERADGAHAATTR